VGCVSNKEMEVGCVSNKEMEVGCVSNTCFCLSRVLLTSFKEGKGVVG